MHFIIDLFKSKTAKPPSDKTPKTKKLKLPEGGTWRTIRGAKVYIYDGQIIAGMGGKQLHPSEHEELSAIFQARTNKKTYDNLLFEGTEIREGKKRKVGTVVKLNKTHAYVDYHDGQKPVKLARKDIHRADAYKLKMEEKLDGNGGKTVLISPNENLLERAEKRTPERQKQAKNEGVVQEAEDQEIANGFMREQKFTGIKAPLLVRDSEGNPTKVPLTGPDGKPVTDPVTGTTLKRYVYEDTDNATEGDILRDHQGVIISEIVNPYAKRYGLEYIQREWRDENGEPTDLYGDLAQTANIGFLYGLREYAQKVAKGDQPGVPILTHALMRARQQTKRHAQEIFSDVKLPEKLLQPMAIITSTEDALMQKLNRKPTEDELAKELQGNPTFNTLAMKSAPYYDRDKEKFVDGKPLTDPVEKLRAIKAARQLQHVERLARVQNDDGDEDKAVTLEDTIQAERQHDAKSEVEKRARQLKKLTAKLVKDANLTGDEVKIVALRFGIGNRKQNGVASMDDIASAMGKSVPWVKKYSASAMQKLRNAPKELLDSLKEIYMTKSLDGMDIFMKALYMDDLQKSLEMFGLNISDLDTEYTRTVSGSADDIKKSLGVTEFIGSIVSTGTDYFQARLYEYAVPFGGALIMKAYSYKENIKDRHASIENYFKTPSGQSKLKTAVSAQGKALGKKNGQNLTWSERLVVETPGAWITWHGRKVFISGKGQVVYDSDVSSHVEKHNPSNEPIHDTKDTTDTGHEAVAEYMGEVQKKWKESDPKGKLMSGYVKDWREKAKQSGPFNPEGASDAVKAKLAKKVDKQFPEGKFLITDPYTGKRVVVVVESQAYTDKDGQNASTAVTYAFNPDADEKVNIGNWAEIRRYLYGDIPKENHYEYFMNKANQAGKHQLEVLSDEDYNKLYGKTKEGMTANMVHTNFKDVTPETLKKIVYDPEAKKNTSVVVPYTGSRIYQAELGDGRVSRVEINESGMFDDPVMQKLINPVKPIRDANDLYTAFKNAIGNEAWVTIQPSKLDQLSHHVKLKYDGQGAPIVVGGAFGGYRFQDANEVSDPEERKMSLFRGGQPIRPGYRQTEERDLSFEVGNNALIRDPNDKRKWVSIGITDKGKDKDTWQVEYPDGQLQMVKEDELRHDKTRYNIAQEAPIIDTAKGGMLNISVPEGQKAAFNSLGIELDDEGRANISMKQFMDIRDQVGSFSLTRSGREFVEDYYKAQYRDGKPDIEALKSKYDPNNISGYKDTSFLKKSGYYNTQVEGMEHLLTAKKGIAGYGMGSGKTLIGIGLAMHQRDEAIKKGEKPKKTLIVSPSAITSEWLKEINRHTNVGAVVVAGDAEHGSMSGQVKGNEDLRSKVIGSSHFNGRNNEHFVIITHDELRKNYKKYAKMAKNGTFGNVIVDEVHAFKNPTGTKNRALTTLAGNIGNVWAMSGTPMDNEVMDAYHLVNAITAGNHDLGTQKEFEDTYMLKNGSKIAGMNESKMDELGKKMSKYLSFRNGYDDTILARNPESLKEERISFPKVNADNRYHGEISNVVDAEAKQVNGRTVLEPKPETSAQKDFYKRYGELESKLLSDAQRQNLEAVAESGMEASAKGEGSAKNFLPGVMRLQQFINAPNSMDAYYEIGKNPDGSSSGERIYGKYKIDPKTGHKLYYKATFDKDGKPNGYEKDANGNPVTLPPLHENNPKAMHLRNTILQQLAAHDKEMEARAEYNTHRMKGEAPKPVYAPKIVIASKYTNFGTEIIENVLRDIERDFPQYSHGSMIGGMSDAQKNDAKTKFQDRNSNHSFIVISDTAKEGVDLGNAHMLIHYDQDFNPNKMAQKSARALRSDSWKHAQAEDRENKVKIVSLNMPGTVEDTIMRAQERKMQNAEQVEMATRKAEGAGVSSDFTKIRSGSQRKWVQRKVEKPPVATGKTASMHTVPLVIKF